MKRKSVTTVPSTGIKEEKQTKKPTSCGHDNSKTKLVNDNVD